MSALDWTVLLGTLIFIVAYGTWKTRGSRDLNGYLKGDNDAQWWGIGISIMATQASAITFLSTPGQAYTDGMRFVQFYFGLPVAMIILSVTFIPIFYRLKVFTAYEFLEERFDLRTRTLTALLFLVQRGLAAGITIYAPSIILSTLLDWDLTLTNILIGSLVIVYTVSGGTRAVAETQKQQMAVMMGGMLLAGIMVVAMLPKDVSMNDALHVAGKLDRLNVVNFGFDLSDRYNFWSGMTAALFLFMSYFGTDQSQVSRYINGRSISESRLGLMMNGLLKVPMQFIILFIGVTVFVFYQFSEPPVYFNRVQTEALHASDQRAQLTALEMEHTAIFSEKQTVLRSLIAAQQQGDTAMVSQTAAQAKALLAKDEAVREQVKALVKQHDPKAETNDKDYIFMGFVMDHLPMGMVGLLFAVMFCAAMSSTSSELNALASTTVVDLYKRSVNRTATDAHYLTSSKAFTFLWGVLAIVFATTASLFENLIQAVNLLGSLFYGTILGIFLVAFYVKHVKGNAVFVAALLAEACVLYIHFINAEGTAPQWLTMGYLWYNIVGCALVVVLSMLLQRILPSGKEAR